MKKRIEISLCRVSASGKYLDIICNAPSNSEFVSMYITTEHLEGGEFVTQEFEIQDAFTDPAKRSYTFKLPVSKFNLEGIPAIYQIKLTAEDLDNPGTFIEAFTFVSDINDAYRSMLDDILSMGERCSTISDEAIQKYLILYGHTQALYLRQTEEAKMLFKILVNKFSNCSGTSSRGSCGQSYKTSYVKSNCGCKR